MQICADTTFEVVHFSLGSRESRDGDDLLCTFTSIQGKNAEDSKNEEDDTIKEVRDSADIKRFDNEKIQCPVKWMILSDCHVYDFTLPVDSHTCRHVSSNSIHIVAYNFWWANGLQLPWALEQQGETVKLEFVISSNLQCASFISVAVALLGSCSTKLNGPVDHLKLRHWGHYQVQLQW